MAAIVWAALGDVANYVEPFAGSLAVLLERPAGHRGCVETVNDADAYVANFRRATTADPEGVAREADWPVNETDLFARHLWLVTEGRARLTAMEADPTYYDVRVAGWWLWGQCAWIGSGWCSGGGPWKVKGGQVERGTAGQGVHRQLPHLGTAGQGVHRQLPHLGAGRGVHRTNMTAGGAGASTAAWNRSLWREGEEPLVYGYMRALQARLRRVRVCCGDWARVVTEGALTMGATVGVFLDPPYDDEVRTRGLYAVDGGALSADVRAWCLAHGDDPRLRLVLCGYEGEHAMPDSWRVHKWSSSGAYLGGGGGGVNRENRHRERLWFSPGCQVAARQGWLWEGCG